MDGRWCYLYWVIDADGTLVDSLLNETRDRDAAKRFFVRARTVVGHAGEGDDGRARRVPARDPRDAGAGGTPSNQSLYEQPHGQDHYGSKQRYDPRRGFGSFEAAARFCSAHDELRAYPCARTRMNETVPLADQRQLFRNRWGKVCAVMQAA